MTKRSFLNRLLIMLIIAAAALQPVFADAETQETSAGADTAVIEAAYTAASGASEAMGRYFWRISPSGDAVKSKGGVPVSPAGSPDAEAPELDAKGAAIYSYDLNRIVYAKNENERLEPYSTTKLLTCYLALTNLGQDDIVTVSADATQAYENGTTIWLKEGEQISVRDLVYGAMLESGNDAAYALGEAVSGSEADFAELMNKTAAEWGCKDTHFVNANGWKNEQHYTTPHDMAVITARCLENEQLREIATTKKYTIPETNLTGARELKNYFLHVIDSPDGITGGKTGTWDDDDCSVVCSFTEAGLDAVIVLLGDTEDGRPEDVRKLMAFSHEVTPGFIVPAQGSPVRTAMVRHGEKTRTTLVTDAVTYAYPADNDARDIRTEMEFDRLEAPLKKGQEVGQFLVYADDELIGEHKLLASEDIETGWLPSYLYISDRATVNALKVIGIFVVLLLVVSLAGRGRRRRRKPGQSNNSRRSTVSSAGTEVRRISRKEKKEARNRLREKYRDKH